MNIDFFCNKAEKAAHLMKHFASAHRLMILCRLHEGECSVGALEDQISLSQSALSQHLARLRRDGLVKTRREAQTIYYRLSDPKTKRLIKEIYALYCNDSKSSMKET